MSYRSAADIITEAQARGMRKAFFVTALLLEMESVRAHLTHMGSVAGRDGTIFECGSFSDRGQEWLVVVAETGAGTHPAQNVASQGHMLFGDFEVQVVVGVGGSRKKDAPLGSVVASDKVYMPYSGKAAKGGFSHRPTSFPLDLRLISIARKVRRDGTWPTRVRPPLNGFLPPPENYPVGYPPKGIVAPIASIEAVLDDPESELEALLAQGYSDTCVVEMEGYGAVYAASAERTPTIVVRGVSDMTQGKSAENDSVLQPIAASHAAAFAFEMVSHWGQLYARPGAQGTATPSQSPVSPQVKSTYERTPNCDDPPVTASAAIPAVSEKAKVTVVLSVSSNFGSSDGERLKRFEASLRAIASDEGIQIVDAQDGSLFLFIADPNAALTKVDNDTLTKGLIDRENARLLGIASIEEFERLQRISKDFAAASSELLTWPSTLPDGKRLERPELGELRSRINGNVSSTTAILGAPGAGKSALLATLSNEYASHHWPVLGIKADLLEAEINSEAALRDRLGLGDLPSEGIRRLAEFGPVLLVIDQLDALAGYVDLRTSRLSVLLNLVRKVGRLKNVHIVLSSRVFEFQHDSRLKSIQTESVALELPAWSEVIAVLEAKGVSASGWPRDAQEVMRSPQSLSTYLRLNSHRTSEVFTSYQAMLDQLWLERVLASDNSAKLEQLATQIADQMAAEESLWLARARFASRTTEINTLIGAGILVARDGSVGFSHQTLFEFALARSFARERGRLSKFIIERQSSLFLRPKLWAGLTYLRATEVNSYHEELEAIWRAQGLRSHLRVLLVDFLGSQLQPTDREALVFETALTEGELRLRAFRSLSGSPGWFSRFGTSFISQAMVASDSFADAQVEVLVRALPFDSERVVQLIRERWLSDSRNDLRIWSVLDAASVWEPAILEIARVVIGRTPISTAAVDRLAATLGVEQPEIALHLVRTKLDRELEQAKHEAAARASKPQPNFETAEQAMAWRFREDPREPLRHLVDRNNDWDSLAALAERAPQAFLDILWPWYLTVFQALHLVAEREAHDAIYPLRYDADYRFEGESDLPEPTLLGALRVAIERIAELDADGFTSWVAQNKTIELAPVQRIIAHGLVQSPQRFATLGLDFLLEDPRRFNLGSIEDLRGTSKALVAAVSPFWSAEELSRFEGAVRKYQPSPPAQRTDPKDRMSWRHSVRHTQLDLLRSLPEHRRSAYTKRQVAEGERAYGARKAGAVFGNAKWIGSVLAADAMVKTSDENIISAFTELPDSTGWDHPRSWMAGGNIQLARAFATFAKDHPDRAVRIVKALSKDTGTRAAAYTLDALSESAEPIKVFALLRDVVDRGFDGEEFRQSVAHALERLSRRNVRIDDEFMKLLEGWLRTPIPAQDEDDLGGEEALGSQVIRNGEKVAEENVIQRSPLWGLGGIEFVPGGAYPIVEVLLEQRLARQEQDQALGMLGSYLDREKRLKVWQGLLKYLPELWQAHPSTCDVLLHRLTAEVPGFVGSKSAAQLLAMLHHRDANVVNHHLDVWQMESSVLGRQAYGEIVGLIALMKPELEWAQLRLERILADKTPTEVHAGVALSAANAFAHGRNRASASQALASLLAFGGKEVWEATFDVFRLVEELIPDSGTIALLEAIADHIVDAPQIDATFVVDRLATLLPHQAQLIGRIAHSLIEKWRDELNDIRTSTAMAASELVDLAITLHRLGPDTRELGTVLFEQLIGIDAFEARQMLDEIDNRFRSSPATRRRLPRRPHQTRRRRAQTTQANEPSAS